MTIRVIAQSLLVIFGTTAIQLESSAANGDERINIVIHGDIRGTNPGVTRDGDTDTILHHMFEALVAQTERLEVRPLLADSIEISEDRKTYTFKLRTGLSFHNGQPLTAAEVVWSWERMLDPETGWRCRQWYDGTGDQGVRLDRVAAIDSATVVFQIAEASSTFLQRMANVQCLTAIVHPESVSEDGAWLKPIGTGPYMLSEWRRGEFVELERFAGYQPRNEPRDGYAGGRESLTKYLRFQVIPEASVAEAGILTGSIDIMPRLPLHLVDFMKHKPGVCVSGQLELNWTAILIQTSDPLLSDIRFRRAIAHAINIDQVAAISTFDRGVANASAVPVSSPYYGEAQRKKYDYDPDKSRELLKEVGYQGQAITIQANRKYQYMFDNAVAVQAMLAGVGINLKLDIVDWATQLSNYYSGNYQLSAFGFSGRTHPIINYSVILGDKDNNPSIVWGNKAAMDLLQQWDRGEADNGESTLAAVHELMLQDLPLIGLYNEFAVDVMRCSIDGYEPWSIGRPRLWGVRKGS